jgi:hypothetical protein
VATVEWIPPPKPCRNEPSRDIAAQFPAGQWMHCIKLIGLNQTGFIGDIRVILLLLSYPRSSVF